MTKAANIPNQGSILNPARTDDRPMTRGGLGGFQSNAGGFNRQVQDKTFYLGVLRFNILKKDLKIIKFNFLFLNSNQDLK